MRFAPRSLVAGTGLCAALALAGATTRLGAAQATFTLPVQIHAGSCQTLKPDVAYKLNDLARPTGTGTRALPASAETTLDASLAALQASPYAIVVTRSSTTLKGAVACGEINSVANADGSIAVGLREMNGSTYGGVALLTANGGQTTIRVYAAATIASGGSVDNPAGSDQPADEVVDITIRDGAIVLDRRQFGVGRRVQFNVHNDGTVRHEVILEKKGANEQPLEEGDKLMATARLALTGDGQFSYTFTDAGDFQLACHIGDHAHEGEVLPITVQ